MKKEVIILTKSARHHNFCVVGVDTSTNKLIRLVSSNKTMQGSLSYNNMMLDIQKSADIFDKVEIDFIRHNPTETHPEDWLIDENVKWKFLKKTETLNPILFSQDKFVYGHCWPFLTLEEAQNAKKSIMLINVKNLKITSNEKTKASFIYNNYFYQNFSITDPIFFKKNAHFKEAAIIVTLPNDKWAYDNKLFFKFIAKIFINKS